MNGMCMIFVFPFSFAAPTLVERKRQIVENHRPKSFVPSALKGLTKSPLKVATRRRFELRWKTRPSMQRLNVTALPAHRVYERMQKRMSIISTRRPGAPSQTQVSFDKYACRFKKMILSCTARFRSTHVDPNAHSVM